MCFGPGSGQGQPPWMMNSLRDNKGSYRAVPAAPYLGIRGAFLKGRGKCLKLLRNLAGEGRVSCPGWALFGLIQRVGKHQGDEQHGAFSSQAACRALRRRPMLVEHRTQPPQLVFLAIATGNGVAAVADGQRYICHQLPDPWSINASSVAMTWVTRSRSASCRRVSATSALIRAAMLASIRAIARSIRSSVDVLSFPTSAGIARL